MTLRGSAAHMPVRDYIQKKLIHLVKFERKKIGIKSLDIPSVLHFLNALRNNLFSYILSHFLSSPVISVKNRSSWFTVCHASSDQLFFMSKAQLFDFLKTHVSFEGPKRRVFQADSFHEICCKGKL